MKDIDRYRGCMLGGAAGDRDLLFAEIFGPSGIEGRHF